MVCLARRPGGVVVSIRCPALAAFADGVGEEEQPGANVTTSAAATLSASRRAKARCCAARRLFSLGVPGNVEHNFELQQ